MQFFLASFALYLSLFHTSQAFLSQHSSNRNLLSSYLFRLKQSIVPVTSVDTTIVSTTPSSSSLKLDKWKDMPPLKIDELAIVGFISQAANTADETIFRNVYDRKMTKCVKCIADSEKFARRRIVNPKTVYSGLIDNMRFVETPSLTDIAGIETAVTGSDGLLLFNITVETFPEYVSMVKRLALKRVVFAVDVTGHEADNTLTDEFVDQLFNESDEMNSNDKVIYTVIKYGRYDANVEESKRPFRIVLGETPVPVATKPNQAALASGDLIRVLAECIDLPKAFNRVFGIGPGNSLDNEILVWMKAQGIAVSDRVAVLLSDFQEVSEKRLLDMNEDYKMRKAQGLPLTAPGARKKSKFDDESILRG